MFWILLTIILIITIILVANYQECEKGSNRLQKLFYHHDGMILPITTVLLIITFSISAAVSISGVTRYSSIVTCKYEAEEFIKERSVILSLPVVDKDTKPAFIENGYKAIAKYNSMLVIAKLRSGSKISWWFGEGAFISDRVSELEPVVRK